MEGWTESTFMRVVLVVAFFTTPLRISRDLYGAFSAQSWESVFITLLLSCVAGAIAWSRYRVFTRN